MRTPYTEVLVERAGIVALYGFAASITISTAGLHAFGMVALISMFLFYRQLWQLLQTSWLVRVVTLLTLYVALQSFISLQQRPVLAENGNPNWAHFLLTSGLPSLALAFFMARNPVHIVPVMLTMVAVLALTLGLEVDWLRVMSGEFHKRGLWEERSASETSFLAASAMIVLLAISAKRARYSVTSWKDPVAILSLLVVSYFLLILIGSQTRGVWAGTVAAFVYLLIASYKERVIGLKSSISLVVAFALVIGALAYVVDADRVWERRVEPVLSDVTELVGKDLEHWQAEERSVSHRMNRWAQGAEAWKARPIFGWGGGARAYVGGEVVDMPVKNSGHFHNLYLEWLAGYGLIGLLLLLALWILIGRDLRKDRWQNIEIISWAFMAAVTVFVSTRIGRVDGRSVIILMTAVAMAKVLPLARPKEPDARFFGCQSR